MVCNKELVSLFSYELLQHVEEDEEGIWIFSKWKGNWEKVLDKWNKLKLSFKAMFLYHHWYCQARTGVVAEVLFY